MKNENNIERSPLYKIGEIKMFIKNNLYRYGEIVDIIKGNKKISYEVMYFEEDGYYLKTIIPEGSIVSFK